MFPTIGYTTDIFSVFSILFAIVVAVRIIAYIVMASKGNRSPREIVNCTVISKRKTNNETYAIAKTGRTFETYYATFALQNGQTKEFKVLQNDYETLQEGQSGKLAFQGKKFFGFRKDWVK